MSDWYGNRNNEENGEEYAFQTLGRNGRPKTIVWSLASLVMGVIAIFTCFFGWSSLILGAAAIVFAILSRRMLGYFDGRSIAGLILGIFGVVFGFSMIIYAMTIDEEDQKYIWDWIKKMFEDIEEGGGSTL